MFRKMRAQKQPNCLLGLRKDFPEEANLDITSHLSQWLLSINQQATSVGGDVEKREL